jgi:hypothetical protein
MQLYISILRVLKLFQPEDDRLWLKHVAEIGAVVDIAVLTAVYCFVL